MIDILDKTLIYLKTSHATPTIWPLHMFSYDILFVDVVNAIVSLELV